MLIKNMRPFVAAVCLSVSAAVFVAPTVVVAADKQEMVSTKVGKPLQEAITAAQGKRYDDALAKLRDAESISEKTPFDQFKINQTYAWIYISQKRYGDAAAVTEKLMDSGFLSASEADLSTKQLVQMYLQVKNYPRAMEHLQRWLKVHPGDTDMVTTLGQLQYQAGQNKQALETFAGLVSSAERSGTAPKESWLKSMFSIAYQANGSSNALDKQTLGIVEKLLRYYPNEAYWQTMLAGLKSQLTTDTARFQLYRLMLSVGTLKDGNDYIEAAQLANNFGYPGEALSILEAGFSKNVLGTGPTKDREQRLRASFQKAADADKANLANLARNAAKNTASGQEDAALGEDYLGYGMNAEAIEALERGIKEGNLKRQDQAQIALGIAYLRSGQADKARASFKQVTGDSELARIASLWSLHAAGRK